ncbi:unnamed protein product [Rhizopus stolonifer]
MDHILSTDWDTTSLAVKEIHQGYAAFRLDCIIITCNGIEVGTIEIKPLNTCKELVDIDVCKIAEICKRIIESLPSDEEEGLPPLFDEYSDFIKSTIALKDEK